MYNRPQELREEWVLSNLEKILVNEENALKLQLDALERFSCEIEIRETRGVNGDDLTLLYEFHRTIQEESEEQFELVRTLQRSLMEKRRETAQNCKI